MLVNFLGKIGIKIQVSNLMHFQDEMTYLLFLHKKKAQSESVNIYNYKAASLSCVINKST